MGPSVFWNCPGYFCDSIYLMSGHICYIPFSLELDSRCEVVISHSKWVGSGRVTCFCRKVAFSRVWESVSHCIPDTRFLDFAQQSNCATEPWYAVGGVHLGPVEQLLCCRKLATSSVCIMTGPPPALHRTGPACLCVTGSTPRAPHGAGTDGVWSRPASPAAAPAHG
jgi:hypothetical protein